MGNLVIEQKADDQFIVYPLGGGNVTTWRNVTLQEVIGRYEAQGYRYIQKDGAHLLMYGKWEPINEVVPDES